MRYLLLLLSCALGTISGETASAQTWEELTGSNEAQLELAIANDSVQELSALPASLLGMGGYWVAGLWTPTVTRYYFLSLPIVSAATLLGRAINRRMSGRTFLISGSPPNIKSSRPPSSSERLLRGNRAVPDVSTMTS